VKERTTTGSSSITHLSDSRVLHKEAQYLKNEEGIPSYVEYHDDRQLLIILN